MIPTLFSGASLIAPSPALISAGYVAGNTLSAQHFNWYLNHLTAELNNLLAGVGITQLATDDYQIMKAVGRAQIAITATGTTTATAFTGDTWVKYNNAGAATYDISAGASRAGVMLFVEETNASGVTIQTAPGQTAFLGIGAMTLLWDGTRWVQTGDRAQVAITATGTTTASAFTGDTWVKYNNAGAATYDISAGANRAGVMLFIEETNANGVTIQTASGTGFLGIGAVTLLWDGTQWVQTGGNIGLGGSTVAPIPRTAAGVGQWWAYTNPPAGAAAVLPAGGTWAWTCDAFNGSGGWSPAYNIAGVSAGGTTVQTGISGSYLRLFAWRIA
jgi:hypothetical protein